MLKGSSQLDERFPVDVGTIQVNFCKTPAMRLGLAKGKITIENIIYYQ